MKEVKSFLTIKKVASFEEAENNDVFIIENKLYFKTALGEIRQLKTTKLYDSYSIIYGLRTKVVDGQNIDDITDDKLERVLIVRTINKETCEYEDNEFVGDNANLYFNVIEKTDSSNKTFYSFDENISEQYPFNSFKKVTKCYLQEFKTDHVTLIKSFCERDGNNKIISYVFKIPDEVISGKYKKFEIKRFVHGDSNIIFDNNKIFFLQNENLLKTTDLLPTGINSIYKTYKYPKPIPYLSINIPPEEDEEDALLAIDCYEEKNVYEDFIEIPLFYKNKNIVKHNLDGDYLYYLISSYMFDDFYPSESHTTLEGDYTDIIGIQAEWKNQKPFGEDYYPATKASGSGDVLGFDDGYNQNLIVIAKKPGFTGNNLSIELIKTNSVDVIVTLKNDNTIITTETVNNVINQTDGIVKLNSTKIISDYVQFIGTEIGDISDITPVVITLSGGKESEFKWGRYCRKSPINENIWYGCLYYLYMIKTASFKPFKFLIDNYISCFHSINENALFDKNIFEQIDNFEYVVGTDLKEIKLKSITLIVKSGMSQAIDIEKNFFNGQTVNTIIFRGEGAIPNDLLLDDVNFDSYSNHMYNANGIIKNVTSNSLTVDFEAFYGSPLSLNSEDFYEKHSALCICFLKLIPNKFNLSEQKDCLQKNTAYSLSQFNIDGFKNVFPIYYNQDNCLSYFYDGEIISGIDNNSINRFLRKLNHYSTSVFSMLYNNFPQFTQNISGKVKNNPIDYFCLIKNTMNFVNTDVYDLVLTERSFYFDKMMLFNIKQINDFEAYIDEQTYLQCHNTNILSCENKKYFNWTRIAKTILDLNDIEDKTNVVIGNLQGFKPDRDSGLNCNFKITGSSGFWYNGIFSVDTDILYNNIVYGWLENCYSLPRYTLFRSTINNTIENSNWSPSCSVYENCVTRAVYYLV